MRDCTDARQGLGSISGFDLPDRQKVVQVQSGFRFGAKGGLYNEDPVAEACIRLGCGGFFLM